MGAYLSVLVLTPFRFQFFVFFLFGIYLLIVISMFCFYHLGGTEMGHDVMRCR